MAPEAFSRLPRFEFELFQSDVKGSILGIPGTSVRIGIRYDKFKSDIMNLVLFSLISKNNGRRNCETFELSFVRGHTNNGNSGSPSPPSNSQVMPIFVSCRMGLWA
jgi:hypothetical protein